MKEVDFKLFIALWNQAQGRTTPSIHFQMANWLEHAWKSGEKRLLLMAFRASGKSTIVGLFAAWLLYLNPALRILVLAADHALAKKMVGNVRRVIELHPLTGHLKPDRPDQWAAEYFTVKRHTVLRDPSMVAKGVTANITGSRADIVICDDVEVPNTSGTADKREQLRHRLSELSFIMEDSGGTQLYIGTPHSYYTIYAEKPRAEIGEKDIFLKGFKRLKLPVMDDDGRSVWPERFTDDDLKKMKAQSGPTKFVSQMMLRPRNLVESRLDPSLLKVYEGCTDYTREIDTLSINQKKMVAASAFWDPAFGSAHGDRSVLAILFCDDEGYFYLQKLAYLTVDDKAEEDEATQQSRMIATLVKEHFLPALTIETNGLGKFLPAILRNELTRAKAPCRVRELYSTRSKDTRILEALEAVMVSQRLYVNSTVLKTPLMAEMQEWRPGVPNQRDDGLDALAGAIAEQPVRLKRLYGAGGYSWMAGAKSQRAHTDFKV